MTSSKVKDLSEIEDLHDKSDAVEDKIAAALELYRELENEEDQAMIRIQQIEGSNS